MPLKAASTTTRKRKKTDDMEESPPKRVTRAKAAAKSATDSSEGPRTTRITTASARIAAEAKAAVSSKAPPKTTRATKRTTKAKKSDEVAADEDAMQEDQSEPVKTRGRPKKTEATAEASAPKITKTRTRQTKAKAEEDTAVPEKPKTRSTRARAVKEDKPTEKEDTESAAPRVTKRSTRTRAGTVTSEPEQPAPVKAKTTKRVTFKDDVLQDKENVPVVEDKTKKPAVKETGLKAKPVRRPAQARMTARTTKTAASTAKAPKTSQPLSPKKVTQVAKSNSISSEDELGKSPEKKPTKQSFQPTPLKKSVVDHLEEQVEEKSPVADAPTESQTQTLLSSPVRKRPASPFKESLKQSPRKFPMFSPAKVLGDVPDMQSQFKDSMKRSPKRLGFTPSKSQSQDTAGVNAPSFNKASLLGSPARRPNSPLKVGSLKLPGKTGAPMPITNTTSALRHMKSSSLFSATPRRLFGTPLKPSKSIGSPMKTIQAPVEQNIEESPEQTVTQPRTETDEEVVEETEAQEYASPMQAPQFFVRDVFSDTPKQFRAITEEHSEDELQSGTPTMKSPIKNALFTAQGLTPALKPAAALAPASPGSQDTTPERAVRDLAMTPLAFQMSKWFAASPSKGEGSQEEDGEPNNIFMPVGALLRRNSEGPSRRQTMTPPSNPTFFEEQMEASAPSPSPLQQEKLEGQDLHTVDDIAMTDEAEVIEQEEPIAPSQESEQYGDENALPQDSPVQDTAQEAVHELSTIPEETYVTPAKVFNNGPRVVYTVSKVPLKGVEEDSPSALKVPKKRSKSMSGPLTELKLAEDPLFTRDIPSIPVSIIEETDSTDAATPKPATTPKSTSQSNKETRTPSLDLASIAGTPFKSPRKGADAQILRGAVVHVDVHTTEGADASGIFVELLTAMGAKCIKQWTWNPRASMVAGEDPTANGKVGITHVVFKDGSKRTLQKVREAKGLVLCVGVGWVLDCERENTWLDEAGYAVDTSTIPRGGHNRRKSMEPKMLANLDGNLVPSVTPNKPATATAATDISPTKEFLNLSSAVSRRDSIFPPQTPQIQAPSATATPVPIPAPGSAEESSLLPTTPTPAMFNQEATAFSPTTPHYMAEDNKMIQQTCPPKQSMQSLFPLSGDIGEQEDESVRKKLLMARRKSLAFAPRVKSPLGRAKDLEK